MKKIVQTKLKAYLRVIPTKQNGAKDDKRVTTSRPVCDLNEKLYKFTKGYKITLTSKDKNDIDDVVGFKSYMYKTDLIRYIQSLNPKFEDKEIYVLGLNDMVYRNGSLLKPDFFFVCADEGELVTKLTTRDQRLQQKSTKRNNKASLLNAFFMDNATEICKKYRIQRSKYSPSKFWFGSRENFNVFIKWALEITVIKELKEIGIDAEIKINKRINEYTEFLDLAQATVDIVDEKLES